MQPVDMALDAAAIVMQNGGSTVAADRTFINILSGYKKKGVAASWRLDFIVATSAEEGQSSTVVRPIGPIGVNLTCLRSGGSWRSRGQRRVAAAGLQAEIARIKELPSPYNRWMERSRRPALAGAFSQLAGGDLGSLGIAFVAAGIGQSLRSQLQARSWQPQT